MSKFKMDVGSGNKQSGPDDAVQIQVGERVFGVFLGMAFMGFIWFLVSL